MKRGVIEAFGQPARSLLKTNYAIEGARDRHPFDVSVVGDEPYLLVHGLSFEGAESPERRNAKGAVAWAVRDIRDAGIEVPLAVLTLRSKNNATRANVAEFRDFRSMISDLGADVVAEGDLTAYAEDRVKSTVPASVAHDLLLASLRPSRSIAARSSGASDRN